MRYANHECAKCGVILPANELTTVTDHVETGNTNYSRRVHGTLRPGGQSRHYADRKRRLCRKCLTKRRLGQLAFGSVAAALFAPTVAIPLIGIGIIVLLLFALRRWLGLILVLGLVAGGAVWLLGGQPQNALQGVGTSFANVFGKPATGGPRPTPSEAPTPADDADAPRPPDVAQPRATTQFGPSRAVEQKLPADKTPYQTCSATVTDHCVER